MLPVSAGQGVAEVLVVTVAIQCGSKHHAWRALTGVNEQGLGLSSSDYGSSWASRAFFIRPSSLTPTPSAIRKRVSSVGFRIPRST